MIMERELIEKAAEYNILFGHRTIDRNIGGRDLAEFGKINFVQGAEWMSKQSGWISVNFAIPEETAEGVVRVKNINEEEWEMSARKIRFHVYPYISTGYVTHWHPIHPFVEK